MQNHVLKLIDQIERLAVLGFEMRNGLDVNLIRQSLLSSYSEFIMNYYMNKIHVSLVELLNMLENAEGSIMFGKSQVILVGESNKREKEDNGCDASEGAYMIDFYLTSRDCSL